MSILTGSALDRFIADYAPLLTAEMVEVDPTLSLQNNLVTCSAYGRFMAKHPYRYYQSEFIRDRSSTAPLQMVLTAISSAGGPTRAEWDERGFSARIEEHPALYPPTKPANVSWYGALFYAQVHGCLLPTAEDYDRTLRASLGEVVVADWSYAQTQEARRWLRRLPVDDPRCDALANGLRNMTGSLWHWTMDPGVIAGQGMLRSGVLSRQRSKPTLIFRHAAPAIHSWPAVGFRCARTRPKAP